ncbi:MAG: hypothetical protein JO190_10485 [Candidatus Eremiobacteraeota bacterium]|nr:hypothetical protein [Candidatus Eremiobacteraeota bacterium]MBV8498612.1 hypothetical protein [Candidatus Eremiobacteraeota bacterium]
MTLRKVPGALALGLLASLGAHAALYGGEHAMGGGYHSLLVQVAIAGALSLVVGLSALAWSAAGVTADGSVLATRLNDRLPGLAALAATAAIWFVMAEGIEPHHAGAPPFAILLALAAAAWIVRRIAIFAVALLARVVFAIARLMFSPRALLWARRPRTLAPRLPLFGERRRFARPPPIVSLHRA